MDNTDNLSTKVNRASVDSCDMDLPSTTYSSGIDLAGHDRDNHLNGIGSQFQDYARNQLREIVDSLSASWSTVNRRQQTAPQLPLFPRLAQDAHIIFTRFMELTPEGGAVFALPIFHDDGVRAGWRVKHPTWPSDKFSYPRRQATAAF